MLYEAKIDRMLDVFFLEIEDGTRLLLFDSNYLAFIQTLLNFREELVSNRLIKDGVFNLRGTFLETFWWLFSTVELALGSSILLLSFQFV